MQDNKKYSQFRAMMAVAGASFKSMLRSPSAIVFSIVFPLIFILAFGFISDGIFQINVVAGVDIDRDNPIYKELIENPVLRITPAQIHADVNEKLQKGQVDAVIDIQRTEGDNSKYIITLNTSTAAEDKASMLKLILNELAGRYNLEQAHVTEPAITIKQEKIEGRKFKMIDFILPGQLGFSLLSTGVFGTAFVFFNFRQTLVIKRFFATPVKRIYILLGEVMSRMIFSILGALVLILIGYYLLDFTLIHGFETLLYLLVLSTIGLIIFMGMGFIISGLAKSSSTIPPLANTITLPQFILSGTFFSIELLPDWLEWFSRILPLTYLNEAMRKVAFEGASISEISTELLILAAWGVVVYAVAVKTFKWE